ncbi:amidohydrolase family protein [Microbacterium aquimaris]|uniref:amidohydrolase family protein n=1 Tax=Microbacterium aquimaris TaxID=459816 RepID=UPI002AD3D6FB|nr:amidohydrolase family protein [Microbacterium aquimaris]MDZ8276763.1 amidohydrolase family protein [Microbacterium aquimaris]
MHDLVVDDAVIVTMNARRDVVRGWIAIDAGEVAALGEGPTPPARERVDACGGIVHPGFLSTHQHSMDAPARGAAGDARDFFDWLFGVYYATVLGHSAADAGRATALTAADLARAGITTVVDCWGVGGVGTRRADECLAASVRAAADSGLRWIVAPMVSDRLPPGWDRLLEDFPVAAADLVCPTGVAQGFAERAFDLATGRVEVWGSVELPEMAGDTLLTGIEALVRARGAGFTTHLCASEPGAVDVTGERAVARLERHGLLRRGTVGAHLVFADADDRVALARGGVGAAHCPAATMLLGGSSSPLGALRDAGIAIGLGLDNATLNATADMGAEVRQALMFDRVAGTGVVRATAHQVFAHATIDGARAIGREDTLGSLEPGKRADLVLVDTAGPHIGPMGDPLLTLVWQTTVADIRLVLVDGEPVHGQVARIRRW